jgi:apolipoprotein D and lipocalin family protein
MRTAALVLVILATLHGGGCARSGALPGARPLEAVDTLDVDRYLGRWYEIERYPTSFQKGLVGVTAEYSRRPDGDIEVVNRGRVGTLDGREKSARARAWVPDPDEPARLRVRFFWPFAADYWVIALDPEYRWAVVGEPGRRYLWILSRTPSLPGPTLGEIRARITDLGFDLAPLQPTPQPPGPPDAS